MRIRKAVQAGLLAVLVPGAQAGMIDFAGGKTAAGLDLGGRRVSVLGSKEKFQEYRDMRDGFLVNDLRLKAEAADSPFFLDFKARNATRADENYRIEVGSYGGFKAEASFDRTLHNFSQGTFILSGAGTGNLPIANQIQAGAQASEQTRAERGGVPTTDTTGEDIQQQAIIRSVLSATDPTSFRLDREKGTLGLEFKPSRDGKAWVKVTDERRRGLRQIGAGTYERYAQGAAGLAHTEDQFFVSGMELADPISYQTTAINAGAGVYKKAWSADLEYTFTKFEDNTASLIWANPFRNTDATATNNADVANNNAYNRGRFTRGQMSLAPSSQSHEVAASGSLELPMKSRLSASAGLGLTTQNTSLLPYTLNSAMAGVGGAPANITDPSILPASRFNGDVRTLTGSLALTSKPSERLGTSIRYHYYDYANRSDQVLFPGYAAFGESYWRTVRNDKNQPVYNDVGSYTRHSSELGADYEVTQPLSVSAETFWDRWDYRGMRLDSTDELGAGAGLAYHAGNSSRWHAGYRLSRRTVTGYTTGNTPVNPEAVGLSNYNWADRKRQKANLGVAVTPSDTFSFGLDGQFQNDDLGAGDRFGLKNQRSIIASLDASYEPSERMTVSLDYSRELRNSRMQNAAKDDAFNVAASALDDAFQGDNFNPFNYWNTEIAETVDTVGLELALKPAEKWDCGVGYSFSYSQMEFDNTNPNADMVVGAGYGNGAKLLNGVAKAWPAVVSRLHEARLRASYQILKDMRVGMNYLFENYMLNDFANTGAYLAGSTPENSTRYVWAGATQFNYTAHALGAYLAWKF